jgi:CO/xanthine dehydrogenase FAD-binding subunit
MRGNKNAEQGMSTVEHYAAPRTLDEAAEMMRDGNVTVLAGGTDLMPQAKAGKLAFKKVLMNVRRIAGLRGITLTDDMIRIGAATTITDMLDHPEVKARLAVLWQACDHFASDQIRNVGTTAGDTLVPLLTLNAQVVLVSKPNGALLERRIPLREFLAGPGKTRREAHELVAAVEIEQLPRNFVSAFFKFGTRPALDISTISIGFGAQKDGLIVRDVRVAFGAVAPTPIRAPHVESALDGKALDDATIATACLAAEKDIRPISDVRATDWYRRELIRNMLERMLNNVRNG